ncbi:MAG: hypothetical protein J6S74_01845 [Alphaproteobacteria bacterium]|nr:hypothetical protein [Alphaproteobacteria bacterium]
MQKKSADLVTTTRETRAMEFYSSQKNKMADVFRKKMNKKTIAENMGLGLVKGVLVGGILGIILANINDVNFRKFGTDTHTQQKNTNNQIKHPILILITIMTLLSLIESGIFVAKECHDNNERADKLTNNTFKGYFEPVLRHYSKGNDTPFRSTRAAALIINNMPKHELQQLHDYAIKGLVETDEMFIRNSAIAEASMLINDYLQCNPALNKLVQKIMNGEEIKTYIIGNEIQNVR